MQQPQTPRPGGHQPACRRPATGARRPASCCCPHGPQSHGPQSQQQQHEQQQQDAASLAPPPADARTTPNRRRRGLLQGMLGSATLDALSPSTERAQAAGGAGAEAGSSAPLQADGQLRCPAAAAGAAARDPAVNRGCATAGAARQQLAGLLPPRLVELSVEVLRAQAALAQCSTDLEKHRLLVTLKETNRACFMALLQTDLEAMLPLVYTPVIAEACLSWGSLIPRPLGLYVTAGDDPLQLLQHWPSDEVAIAVITDGERILGEGDLGAHGMGIPTGKCSVYTAAGVPPDWLLPITVDVGTDNAALAADPLYVGLPQPRLRGAAYASVMQRLLEALQQRFGRRLVVHWEDLALRNAVDMLQRTRALGLATFNDDTQCTAAVALAAVLGGLRVPGVPPLTQQTFCLFGAGQANLGIAQLLVAALRQRGLSEQAAKARIWLIDRQGLITTDRQGLTAGKAAFAGDPARLKGGVDVTWQRTSSSDSAQLHAQLAAAVEATQASALIGAAAVPGAFGRPVIEALTRSVQAAAGAASARPLVLALSNPTSKAEVSFEDALAWSGGGRAVYASGSPFPPVAAGGAVLRPAQANNCFVFSGLALGLLGMDLQSMSRQLRLSKEPVVVDDALLLVVAQTLAGLLSASELEEECVLPRVRRLPEVTAAVAAAVAQAVA